MTSAANAGEAAAGETTSAARTIGAGLRVGIVLGAVAGLLLAVRFLAQERDLELGLVRLGLREAAARAAWGLALGAATGAALALAVHLVARVLRRAPLRRRPAHPLGAAILVVALQIAALGALGALRALPGWPALRSPGGIAAAAGLSLVGVALALALARTAERVGAVAAWVARILGARALALLAALLVGCLVTSALVAAARQRPTGPNLVLVTVDTLRADHLGAYGYGRDTSPEIDRLAREGVRFDRAIAQWPKTTPSFVSLHTGTYASTNGITRDTQQPLPAGLPTIAERLSDAGYATAAVVTNANLGRLFRFDQGFDVYEETWRESTPDDPERAGYVTDHALAWLARRPADRPFFLWVHYVDPHARYEPPAPFDGMFVGDAHYDPSRRAPLHSGRDEDMGGIPARSRLGDRDEIDYYVAQYDAEIRYTDREIGRLLRTLDAPGLRERTAVVLTADHGEALGEHDYFFDHGRLPYDDCARVPLIVRPARDDASARDAAAGVVARPVELIDLLPTLLAWAGLDPGQGPEGRSLVSLLSGGEDADRPAFAFTESGYTTPWQRAVRDADWKLIHVPDPADQALMRGAEWELYALGEDPGETRNLAAERPQELARLREALGRWASAHRAPSGAPSPSTRLDRDTEERLRNLGYVE